MCICSESEAAFVLNFVHYLWGLKTGGKFFFFFGLFEAMLKPYVTTYLNIKELQILPETLFVFLEFG